MKIQIRIVRIRGLTGLRINIGEEQLMQINKIILKIP